MDLIHRLRRWALACPRVLIVATPGTDPLRWAVESELDRRGCPLAESPAQTDLLAVLGAPGPQLSTAIELLRGQVPDPRHRLDIADEQQVYELFAAAAGDLVPAGEDPPNATSQSGQSDHETDKHETDKHETETHGATGPMGHSAHGARDHAAHDPAGHGEHGATGHAAHGARDHNGDSAHDAAGHAADGGGHEGHHMHHGGEVAGLSMAATGPDRDGLDLDVLSVSLGPVLPGWPTGLVLAARMQGDVVTDAHLHWLDDGADEPASPAMQPRQIALDRLASLLWVAGWCTAARDARRARDRLGSADPDERAAAALLAGRVTRRVRRSRTLAWALRGSGRLGAEPERAGGDILDRVRVWCDVAAGAGDRGDPVTTLDDLAAALVGVELATARLIVASVVLDRTAGHVTVEPSHA